MNRKVIAIVAVVVVVVLCALAVIYAPHMMEFMLQMHRIPQH